MAYHLEGRLLEVCTCGAHCPCRAVAATLNNIGGVYDALGQQDQALDYYRQALPILEEVGDRAGESITRYNMAMIYREQGHLAEAAAELRRAG